MTRRDQQIEVLTYSFAEDFLSGWTFEEIAERNASGFTLDLSSSDTGEASRDTIVRYEGVVLSQAELQAAWARAERIALGEEV